MLETQRSGARRAAEPIEAAHEVADPGSPDPVEVLMRREAVQTVGSSGSDREAERSLRVKPDHLCHGRFGCAAPLVAHQQNYDHTSERRCAKNPT